MAQVKLLWTLIQRDIKLRYTQTIGRYLWAIGQPLAIMAVFTLLFNHVLQVESSVPYPLFCFAGLMPWAIFSSGLMQGTTSLVRDSRLIKYSRVPRVLLPLAAALAPLADFWVAFLIFLGMMVYWGAAFSVTMLAVIPLAFLAVAFSLGLSLWLSAINIQYRDIGLIMPFLVSMAMLVSPVAYSTSLTQGSQWSWVYAINPMSGAIEGFRWALLGYDFPGAILWKSGLVSLAVLVSGLWFFSKREPIFADVV